MDDIIVIGGGPAGMTAALYGLRNGKTVRIIEKNGFGGQITNSPKVENIPGFLSMSGNEFADRMMDQIMQQGAELEFENVTAVQDHGAYKTVITEDGNTFEGRAVILATGVKHRLLGLPGEEELIGEGISFCAVCDGDFYTGKDVCMIGGGNSALQEAILLAGKCSKVTVIQDLPMLTGEMRLQETLKKNANVTVRTGMKVEKLITEDGRFRGITVTEKETGTQSDILCDGLFVAIGLIPQNDPFKNLTDLNAQGYFDSDERCLTRTPGVFTAGDCRAKSIRQVTTACADGAVAAMATCRYLDTLA